MGLPQAAIAFEDLQDPEAITNWPLTLGRDGARTPIPWSSNASHGGFSRAKPWLPVPDAHLALAVDAQNGDPQSQLNLTRTLIRLRADHDALYSGAAKVLVATDTLLIIERTAPSERLLCLFNLASTSQTWAPARPEHWRTVCEVNGGTQWILPPMSGLIAEALD